MVVGSFVGSFDGKLYAVDAATGKLAWTFEAKGNPDFPSGELQGSPLSLSGDVLVGSSDSAVAERSADA